MKTDHAYFFRNSNSKGRKTERLYEMSLSITCYCIRRQSFVAKQVRVCLSKEKLVKKYRLLNAFRFELNVKNERKFSWVKNTILVFNKCDDKDRNLCLSPANKPINVSELRKFSIFCSVYRARIYACIDQVLSTMYKPR